MAITPDQLEAFAKYVNGSTTEDADYLTQCWEEGEALVDKVLGGATPPASIKTRATLEAASDLYHRKNTRTGNPNFVDALGGPEPFPVLRDPRTSIRNILQPWLSPAIG